jgi:hypothetical protein
MREVYLTPEEWAEKSAHAVPDGPPIKGVHPRSPPMYDYIISHKGKWSKVRIVTRGMIEAGMVPERRIL